MASGGPFDASSGSTELTYDIWRSRPTDTAAPPILAEFAAEPALSGINWREAEMA